MRLAQRARTCPACGRREPPDARWCGDCGESLAVADPPATFHGIDDPVAPHAPARPRTPLSTRVGLAVVLVLAVMAGVVAGGPGGGDPDLLGRLDDATGRSSRLPPLDDLQLLWRRPVDAIDADAAGPPQRFADLAGAARMGDEVVDVRGARAPVHLPAGAAHGLDGRVLVIDDGEVVAVDVRTGEVVRRAALRGDDSWQPEGAALGWVAGAGLFTDADGRLGAVAPDGRVRWIGEADWRWDGVGDGTDWLVVTLPVGHVERVLVVEGDTGRVHRDVGPVGVVHAPAVHGDTLAWVDPHAGVDRGLGHPVEVHGLRLDGSGRIWTVTDLPPTSGAPETVRLMAVHDAVVVTYWSTGQATTAVWLAPLDGVRLGEVTAVGTGRTDEGWPVTAVLGDALAHVDPVRDEVRVLDRRGRVRWSVPALPGEGLVADGALVAVRTPPRGTSLQSRLRLLDAATGETRWDRFSTDTQHQRFIGAMDGHVGVSPGTWPTRLREQVWLDLGTGRRGSGRALMAASLGVSDEDLEGLADLALLGEVTIGTQTRPVLARDDGTVVGPVGAGTPVSSTAAVTSATAGLHTASAAASDDEVAVRIGAASVTAGDPATGRRLWRTTTHVALRPDVAVLIDDVVVVLGVDGVPRALDLGDGTPRWSAEVAGVTAVTAGGDEVVVGTDTGEVVVLGRDGAVLQRIGVGRGAVEDVAVVDGHVLVALGGDVAGLGRGPTFVEPEDRVQVP